MAIFVAYFEKFISSRVYGVTEATVEPKSSPLRICLVNMTKSARNCGFVSHLLKKS